MTWIKCLRLLFYAMTIYKQEEFLYATDYVKRGGYLNPILPCLSSWPVRPMYHQPLLSTGLTFKIPLLRFGFGSNTAEEEQIFCWAFENTDYHKHRVVQCEIGEWCSVNNSKPRHERHLASSLIPTGEVKCQELLVVIKVLRDTKLQWSATINTDMCFTWLPLLAFFFLKSQGRRFTRK